MSISPFNFRVPRSRQTTSFWFSLSERPLGGNARMGSGGLNCGKLLLRESSREKAAARAKVLRCGQTHHIQGVTEGLVVRTG